MHRATAQVSAWFMYSSITQPGGKSCAYGARAARVAKHSNQHMILVAKGAHIAMQAKANLPRQGGQ